MRFILFLALVLSSSCQKKHVDNKVVRLNFHSEPTSFDPRLSRDLPSLTVCRMLYEGLFRPYESGVRPALVRSFSCSEDELTYTFELKNALWSDGNVVTAHDFELAWKSVLSPNCPAESVSQLFIIKGAREAKLGIIPTDAIGVCATGPLTLKIELIHPDPYLFERLCHPVAYPIPSKRIDKQQDWTTTVSNGPFKVVESIHGDHILVEKNPYYWDKKAVKLDQILITLVEDEHTELNMYENNELDWAGSPNSSVPPEAIPSLKNTKSNELFIRPLASTYSYRFNTLAPPFNNAKIRAAFSKAIQRQMLIDNILQAGQVAAASLIPPSLGLSSPTICSLQQPIALFEEGLKEEGWTRETMPSITLTFSKSEKHQKVAQAVQQQWSSTFQIKTGLQSYEWNVFLSKLASGEFQVGGRGWIGELTDPKGFLEPFQEQHETGWVDEQFALLLKQADATTDAAKREAFLQKAEMRLLASSVIAPVYHSTACYLKKEYLKGVQMTQLCDLDFKEAYIEH